MTVAVGAPFSGIAPVFISRRSMLVGMVAVATGCARSDWVGSTLVTVDVTGAWQGTYASGTLRGSIAMKLEQRGAKVTGTYEISGYSGASGAVAGTISGDTLRFEGASLMGGQLTIGVDDMAGFLTRAGDSRSSNRMSVLLLRQ